MEYLSRGNPNAEDVAYLKHAAQLLNTLQHKLLMRKHLPALHYAHNTSINCITSVLVNILNHFFPFIHRRQRNLDGTIKKLRKSVHNHTQTTHHSKIQVGSKQYLYPYPPHSVSEFGVEFKIIRWRNSSIARFFGQNFILGTRQRLK